MEDFKVSVIIPLHNAGRYLSQSLESIFRQTFHPFEIIVVDDCSTDNSSVVCNDYKDKIRYMKNSRKCGPAASRNRGVHFSKGNWIAFLDADDLWFPTKLEKQIAKITKDVGFVHCCDEWFWDNIHREPVKRNRTELENGKELFSLYRGKSLHTSSVLIRKDIFEQVKGFNEDLFYSEDYDLWIRCAAITKFAYVDEVLTRYRQHEQQATSLQNIAKKHNGHIATFIKNKNVFLNKFGITEKDFARDTGYRIGVFARDAFISKAYILSIRHLIKASAWYPKAIFFALGLMRKEIFSRKNDSTTS